ncbi:MAG TPA: hypothetical protein DCP37_04395 [Dehalococcoidia bacterium]|nr:PQQ-like beta-propeller repeat protein [SAR202 cluster bacterium]HAL46972.1 hypothetical protein [Dehalococcoidia bacterium]|tara:strand:+ start:6268 stop:7428 length:1161 start_codon:yes stop_codon:yes gene_type:complete
MLKTTGSGPRKAGIIFAALALALMAGACSRISNPQGWSGVAASGDTLVVGTQEGQLLAIDKNDGSTLWRRDLIGEEDEHAIYGAPIVDGEVVFAGSYDGRLYAFDLEGLPARWGDRRLDDRIVGGLTLAGESIVVGSVSLADDGEDEGTLWALDAVTGDELWRFTTPGPIWTTPTVADGLVFIGTLNQMIYAVNLSDGQKAWQFETGGGVVAKPLVSNGRVYVGAFDSVFYALDAKTGAEAWRFSEAEKWFWAGAIARDNLILAPSLDGNLYALDATSGFPQWKIESEGSIVGSPVIVGDLIAVPIADGGESKISLVEINGSQREACKIGEDVRTPLSTDGELIYFAATNHSIWALRIKQNGNPDEEWVYFTDQDDPIPRDRSKAC